MEKIWQNKTLLILMFLGLFGFSIGVFDNYRELWLSSNGLSTLSISHIISVSFIVTVLILFFFTIKVPTNYLKDGILISLVLKLITNAILICLNGTNKLFLIKFLMFFDIAFAQLILASVYPLMMNMKKDDVLYTKKDFVESLSSKIGFLLVSIFVGKTIFSFEFNYNFCLLLSAIFTFLAFLVLLIIKLEIKTKATFDLKETWEYFINNKVLSLYLIQILFGNIIWRAILGMPMLLLTLKLGFSSSFASFLILGLGIVSNIFSIIVVKYLCSKNDHINIFIKYGVRVVLCLLVFIIKNNILFMFTIVYFFLTDCTYNFIFSSYFINKVDEKYSLLLTTLKYCSSLLGAAIGTFFCGIVFNFDLRLFLLPVLVLGVIHYIISTILVEKKKVF